MSSAVSKSAAQRGTVQQEKIKDKSKSESERISKSKKKMVKKKKCLECKKEFEFNPNARFVRKYCDVCSKKRKKMWDNQWKLKFEDFNDEDE